MTKLIAGLDEVATETQLSEGWCYFCIPEIEYPHLQSEVGVLLSKATKLRSFHGKIFKADHATEYEEFLRIVRKYVENSAPTILSCTLNNVHWKGEFREFCETLTTNVLAKLGVTNTKLIDF